MLSKQIDAILESITISEKFREWALAYLAEYREEEADTQDMTLKSRKKPSRASTSR